MAATGYTPIKIYASTTASAVPLAANLDNTNGAELAINTNDGKLYYKDSSGVVQTIASKAGNSGSFSSITDSGNFTFTGTANRFTGDFANATDASRVIVQNSTTNSNTVFGIAPNGTGTIGGVNVYGGGSVANCAVGAFYTSATGVNLNSYSIGSGTTLPLVFNINSAEVARIATNGNVGIGNNSPSAKLDVLGSLISTSYACNAVGGNASIINQSAGDARPLFISNSNASGTPNGLLFISNTNDANNTTYSFIQAVGGSTARFIVYGNGDVNTTGVLSTKSRGISAGSVPVGSVIQVVNSSYSTSVSSSSSTGVATGLTATITPQYSTSKILITVNHTGCNVASAATGINIYLTKNGSTNIANLGNVLGYPATGGVSFSNSGTILDSPATTSAVTYATYFASWQNVASVTVQWQGSTSYITLMEIAA
jgi:hypothetical protein